MRPSTTPYLLPMLIGVAVQVQLVAQPIVTTTADSGLGSLRQVIADGAGGAEGDKRLE